MSPKYWLTVAEAADRLSCSPRWVRYLIDRGEIRAEQLNPRFYLVYAADVAKLARRRKKARQTA
jgi:excisionase family DNA binding protein